jgi:putative sugar O-methyltransferase
LERLLERVSVTLSGVDLEKVRMLCFEFSRVYGSNSGARGIECLEASTVGNPEDSFVVNGRAYSISILNYYVQYAYFSRFCRFDEIDSFCEIGSGSGKQIEVIKKCHPRINFFVFDVPPQLYVCHQYLSALFPDKVVSYRETRTMTRLAPEGYGKIYIFGNWKLPELSDLTYDVFWNSASFQEMEPKVVLNYLWHVNNQTKKFVFLHEIMEGMPISSKVGQYGVLEQTRLEHYRKGLRDFELQDMSRGIYLPGSFDSGKFSSWSRNTMMV